MKFFSLMVSLILVVGCNSKTEQATVTISDKEKDLKRITAKDIETLKYTDYVLSPKAKEAVVGWERYQEFMTQTEFLKQGDFSFFGGKNEVLITFVNELKTGIPPTIESPAIKERLIALETKLLKLNSTLKLSNAKKEEILNNIKELLVATSNLHFQINKKFELESQMIEEPE